MSRKELIAFDMNLLVTLHTLLQESSVTKAARKLGLSTPAVSHALARLRTHFKDPLLVRAGQSMVLTPRAENLRPLLQDTIECASRVLDEPTEFSPQKLEASFSIAVTDYILLILGKRFERMAFQEAPGLALRFVPNSIDDADLLRKGELDIAIGIYGALPPELQMRQLITDRFVCVVRADHPQANNKLTLKKYVQLSHIQVSPRGQPGGYIDDLLASRGMKRRVVRTFPSFRVALEIVSQSDYILTISERFAETFAKELQLKILEPPLPLEPYALSMLWHPRLNNVPAHRWLREKWLETAQQLTPKKYANPRRKLDDSDPTTGQGRRKRKKKSQ